MEPNTLWTAVEQGVMELPTTKFRITYRRDAWGYTLTWDGVVVDVYSDLQLAKNAAVRRMADLIEMGFEV